MYIDFALLDQWWISYNNGDRYHVEAIHYLKTFITFLPIPNTWFYIEIVKWCLGLIDFVINIQLVCLFNYFITCSIVLHPFPPKVTPDVLNTNLNLVSYGEIGILSNYAAINFYFTNGLFNDAVNSSDI
jgi:hypothetical protein